jgi:hypothetical protein
MAEGVMKREKEERELRRGRKNGGKEKKLGIYGFFLSSLAPDFSFLRP